MSKAAAKKWFEDHNGQMIDTRRVSAHGARADQRAARLLVVKGSSITLDGSTVSLTANHTASIDRGAVVVSWWDENKDLISTTIYGVAKAV